MDTKVSAADWSRRIAAWRESGLKAKDFAEREGFSYRSLIWWNGEFKRRAGGSEKATFLPVQIASAPLSVCCCFVEVELLSGHVLRVQPDFDVETVKRLVDAIGGR